MLLSPNPSSIRPADIRENNIIELPEKTNNKIKLIPSVFSNSIKQIKELKEISSLNTKQNKSLANIITETKKNRIANEEQVKIERESLEIQEDAEYDRKHSFSHTFKKIADSNKYVIEKIKESGNSINNKVKEHGGWLSSILKVIGGAMLIKTFWPLFKEKVLPKIMNFFNNSVMPFFNNTVFPFIKDKILPEIKNSLWPFLRDKAFPFIKEHFVGVLTTLAIMSFLKNPISFLLLPLTLALKATGTIGKLLFKGVSSVIGKSAGIAGKSLISISQIAKTKTLSAIGILSEKSKTLMSSVSSRLTSFAKIVKEKTIKSFEFLRTKTRGLLGNSSRVGNKVRGLGRGAKNVAVKTVKGVLKLLKPIAKLIPFIGSLLLAIDLIDTLFPKLWPYLKENFSVEKIQKLGSKIWENIKKGVLSISDWIKNKFAGFIQIFRNGIASFIENKFSGLPIIGKKMKSIAEWIRGDKDKEIPIEPQKIKKLSITKLEELSKKHKGDNKEFIEKIKNYKKGIKSLKVSIEKRKSKIETGEISKDDKTLKSLTLALSNLEKTLLNKIELIKTPVVTPIVTNKTDNNITNKVVTPIVTNKTDNNITPIVTNKVVTPIVTNKTDNNITPIVTNTLTENEKELLSLYTKEDLGEVLSDKEFKSSSPNLLKAMKDKYKKLGGIIILKDYNSTYSFEKIKSSSEVPKIKSSSSSPIKSSSTVISSSNKPVTKPVITKNTAISKPKPVSSSANNPSILVKNSNIPKTVNANALINDLKRDEGEILHKYKDSLGNDTIGVGHLLRGSPLKKIIGVNKDVISSDESSTILAHDVSKHSSQLYKRIPWLKEQPEVIQRHMINMGFNLGVSGLLRFKKSINAIKDGDYNTAADGFEKSKWYRQVKGRAVRIVNDIRSVAKGTYKYVKGKSSPLSKAVSSVETITGFKLDDLNLGKFDKNGNFIFNSKETSSFNIGSVTKNFNSAFNSVTGFNSESKIIKDKSKTCNKITNKEFEIKKSINKKQVDINHNTKKLVTKLANNKITESKKEEKTVNIHNSSSSPAPKELKLSDINDNNNFMMAHLGKLI